MKEFAIVAPFFYFLGLLTPVLIRVGRSYIPKPWGTK